MVNLREIFGLQAEAKSEYSFGQSLGSGACGTVKQAKWEAHTPPIEVAIKIVSKGLIKDKRSARKHLDFVRSLDHPHVVRLFAWFEGRKNFYSVFELAAGGELYDRVQNEGPYTEDASIQIIKPVLEGINYLHDRLIVHRDIKPENILYRSSHQSDLVIADLGFAGRLKNEKDKFSVRLGTPGYCAPEVFKNAGYGKKVDLWAVGVIAYVLLSKHFPYHSSNPDSIIRETMVLEPSFPKFSRPFDRVSTECKDFIRSMLQLDPNKRLSAEEALRHPWICGAFSGPSTDEGRTSTDSTPTLRPLMSRQTTLVDAQLMLTKAPKERTVDVVVPDQGNLEFVRVGEVPNGDLWSEDSSGENHRVLSRALSMPPDTLHGLNVEED